MKHALSALLVLALLSGLAVQADQVYKWVDAQGNVHYSDKPHPGAEKIKVAPPQSFSAPNLPTGQDRREGRPSERAPVTYTLAIASPGPESTLWNTRSVTVSVKVTPALAPGDHITFELDGQPRGPVAATSVTFDDLNRGQHTVSATLSTADGRTVKATPVTFYLRQPTVFHGKPPG